MDIESLPRLPVNELSVCLAFWQSKPASQAFSATGAPEIDNELAKWFRSLIKDVKEISSLCMLSPENCVQGTVDQGSSIVTHSTRQSETRLSLNS